MADRDKLLTQCCLQERNFEFSGTNMALDSIAGIFAMSQGCTFAPHVVSSVVKPAYRGTVDILIRL